MNKILNYFKNLTNLDNIGHAYLIGNIGYDENEDNIKEVIEKVFLKDKIDMENDCDITIVRAIDNSIKKEQIKNLLVKLSTTSQVRGIKIYVIVDCDKLSSSVYNTLLKTLEEPEENIYALLTTNNMEAVGATISSRCQKIFISSSNDEDKSKEDKIINLIDNFEIKGIKILSEGKEVYNLYSDRALNRSLLQQMIKVYKSKLLTKGISELEKKKTRNKILIINETLEKSYYNYNIEMFVNDLFLKLWRINNENSIGRV